MIDKPKDPTFILVVASEVRVLGGKAGQDGHLDLEANGLRAIGKIVVAERLNKDGTINAQIEVLPGASIDLHEPRAWTIIVNNEKPTGYCICPHCHFVWKKKTKGRPVKCSICQKPLDRYKPEEYDLPSMMERMSFVTYVKMDEIVGTYADKALKAKTRKVVSSDVEFAEICEEGEK